MTYYMIPQPSFSSVRSPSELKALVQQYGFTPSKLYGQHYLIREKPIQTMLAAGDVTRTDTIVEVGPGFGVLTLALAQTGATVISAEIEQTLQPYWTDVCRDYPSISLHWGNILRTWPQIIPTLSPGYKVVANLPYQITSEFLEQALEHFTPAPERVVL